MYGHAIGAEKLGWILPQIRVHQKNTPPLYRHHGKMDVSIALFPINLHSITDKQEKLFVDLH